MKKLLFLLILMLSPMLASAQTVSDVQNSGCLNNTRGEEPQRVPTIVLEKEGSVLSVQLLNYESNCCTEDFNVTSNICGGSNGEPCSVSISVVSVGEECDCICPFNVSFTIRDLEPNSFYLDCWWYKGQVELTEGQSYQAVENGSFYPYHPFLKEGKTWNYEEYYHNLWNDEQWTKSVSYVINGTTEIDGKTYYKMYRKSEEGSNYICALREEDRKVWMYTSGNDDHLLYDFGMSVGDTYKPSYEPFYYQLTDIKPMLFHDDQLLNVLYYDITTQYVPTEPANYFASTPIVEGVGCEMGWNILELYAYQPTNGIIQREDFLSCYEDGKCIFTADDFNDLINPNPDYHPFIEDGKVWAVKVYPDGYGMVRDDTWTEHYYFDGDTIIGGQTCKKMFYITNADEENWVNGVFTPASHTQHYIGNWYEQDKKVYFAYSNRQQFELIYDFTLSTGDSIQDIAAEDRFLQVTKMSGGIPGFFKGTYYNLSLDGRIARWLEGVGNESWPYVYQPWELCGATAILLSCRIGDEVIYYNSEVEDPYNMEARKHRFDFTHTIKTQPKAPIKQENSDACISSSEREVARPKVKALKGSEEEHSLYGEYSDLLLGIHLDPLDDAYLVSITNESGQVVYEKAINADNIVGLNIDISAYAKGRYTVTIENNSESFTGQFETQTAVIETISHQASAVKHHIYNLQGQRLSSLQKGLNIVNGQKIYVK